MSDCDVTQKWQQEESRARATDAFYLLVKFEKEAENTLQAPICSRGGREEGDSGNERSSMTHQDDISWRHVTQNLEFIRSV